MDPCLDTSGETSKLASRSWLGGACPRPGDHLEGGGRTQGPFQPQGLVHRGTEFSPFSVLPRSASPRGTVSSSLGDSRAEPGLRSPPAKWMPCGLFLSSWNR